MQTGKAILWVSIICLFGATTRADSDYAPFGDPSIECQRVIEGFVPCKKKTSIIRESKKHYFSSADFNWSCNLIDALEFDFFNSSNRTVRTIVIEGTTNNTRLSENVFVAPGQSKHIYARSSGAFCRKEKGARLYYEYQITSGGGCLLTYSKEEIQEVNDQCAIELEKEAERDAIYNNCVIAKSKGVDKRALINVRSVCRDISKNPSTLQRWRWGD